MDELKEAEEEDVNCGEGEEDGKRVRKRRRQSCEIFNCREKGDFIIKKKKKIKNFVFYVASDTLYNLYNLYNL